jgi:hypothetical protein
MILKLGVMTLKLILMIGILLACSPAPKSFAQTGEIDRLSRGRCQLQVNGTNRINGPCLYHIDRGGSFRIQEAGRRGDDFYFAYVSVMGNTANGSWSGARGVAHAHDPLGELTRSGACWINRTARVCLWAK